MQHLAEAFHGLVHGSMPALVLSAQCLDAMPHAWRLINGHLLLE
jgi:hypothetical protein